MQKIGDALSMAKNPAIKSGTRIGSAARMPATTMTNAAAGKRNRLLDWSESGDDDAIAE